MKSMLKICMALLIVTSMFSCVTKKKFISLQSELDAANLSVGKTGESLNEYMNKLTVCEQENEKLKGENRTDDTALALKNEQIADMKNQIADLKTQRDRQVSQVGELTVLSQSANDNIKETLSQLALKDKYIHLIQAAKTKADSINLALAVNLKGVLNDGIEDSDVEVKVDKTVVYINLSDKMLYRSGSANLTSKANEVLGKIAKIIESRPGFEVMVEGYTDNVPIKNTCIKDNWDLSVKRATSVVRALQNKHNVDPNRLIAAGRGQYNTLAENDTAAGRSTNRRTRIIILPKIDQFYDLLNPDKVPE